MDLPMPCQNEKPILKTMGVDNNNNLCHAVIIQKVFSE